MLPQLAFAYTLFLHTDPTNCAWVLYMAFYSQSKAKSIFIYKVHKKNPHWIWADATHDTISNNIILLRVARRLPCMARTYIWHKQRRKWLSDCCSNCDGWASGRPSNYNNGRVDHTHKHYIYMRIMYPKHAHLLRPEHRHARQWNTPFWLTKRRTAHTCEFVATSMWRWA